MHRIIAAMTTTLAMTATLAAETHHIEITDGAFIPASITVAPGDTIIWTATTIGATIVSGSDCMPEGDFFWGAVPNGGGDGPPNMTFAWSVPAITTEIPYMCIAHCGMGMTGSITIGAAGTTIHVPGDYTTIQAAIDAASDGDAIAIAAGTYTEHDLALGAKGITMTGATNAEGEPAVIIDAQQQSRVMTISGESASGLAPLIEHIVFTGGSSQSPGGGMNCTNSNAFIRNCHFIDNVSDMNGGGVYHSGQAAGPPPDAGVSATFTRCLFTGNTADEGGGIHGRLGHTKLTNCIVTNNTATTGGGLSQCACKYAVMSVSSSTVCGNSPDQIDGPIALDWGSCASPWCEDTDGDGSPDGCLNDNDGMLHVPDEYATIQMAFKSAVDGDTIVIAAGTYLQEEGDELEMTNGMSLSIIGETHSDGTPAVTIDGQGLTTGIMFFGGTEASGAINIENLHLTRFLYPLSLNNCSASVLNCALDTNYGYYGVISIINSHATVESCTVTGNQGTFAGGIQVVDNNGSQSSEVSLIDCVIEGNIGTYPYYAIGGVSLYNGHTTITGCIISGNTSAGLGGVFVDSSATVAIDDTTVCGNVGYDNDTTQINGDFTDNGGNCIEDSCDDCVYCPGDFDGSGTVDVSDLLAVIGSWGDPYDVGDLLLVISLWGNTCS